MGVRAGGLGWGPELGVRFGGRVWVSRAGGLGWGLGLGAEHRSCRPS